MNQSTFNSSKFLSVEEDQAFLNTLESDTTRNGLILLILRLCGMRVGELLSLRPCDLNPSSQTIRVTASKGSADRELPLPDDVFNRLQQHIAERQCGETQLIFNITTEQVRRIWQYYRPGGCKKKLHSLRHTFAVDTYRRTRDILLVKAVLGHRSLQTTMIYQEFIHSSADFKKVLWAWEERMNLKMKKYAKEWSV